tara:strand:- start:90 stop:569 length:480 start_codon:yes stop_codon:yes gene_type:complete
MEIFKDIEGYKGLYQVSNLGRVKSFHGKGKLLKGNKGSGGYLAVGLSKNKKITLFRIHVLVAVAFLGHKPCGYKVVIDHINNIQSDNRFENLRLTTNRYNTSKDKKNKTSKYTGVSWSKSTSKWVTHIKINGKSKHLGLFTDELEASNAYQKALLTLNN